MSGEPVKFGKNTVIVVFGASGDLAKKKTFPALFGLFREGHLDPTTKIVGYARSNLTTSDLIWRISPYLRKPHHEADNEKVEHFYSMLTYISGQYDKDDGYKRLNDVITQFESENGVKESHRLFYLAFPPKVFIDVARKIKELVYDPKGVTRVVIEKPFGRDLKTAMELINNLRPLFTEKELFRIDHYLGKELVKNLVPLRFGNGILNASWNRQFIKNIQISFKEPFGTEGRGGYFDSYGIIRDVMQNHLLQVLTLVCMDRPSCFEPECIRDAKAKVLEAIEPIDVNNILIGQYGKSEDGKKPAYIDDETVNPDSKCVTYAAMTLYINNDTWRGVPIIMRAGKALDAAKVEIRIEYESVTSGIFAGIPNNELVIRVQPNAAVYLKFNAKTPGLSKVTQVTDLDLTYSDRYKDFWIPEAYEVLIRDVLLGDHSNFVRDDELEISWKLFTPLLDYLDSPEAPKPEIYPYGTRGPKGLAEYLERNGYTLCGKNYTWPVTTPENSKQSQ